MAYINLIRKNPITKQPTPLVTYSNNLILHSHQISLKET